MLAVFVWGQRRQSSGDGEEISATITKLAPQTLREKCWAGVKTCQSPFTCLATNYIDFFTIQATTEKKWSTQKKGAKPTMKNIKDWTGQSLLSLLQTTFKPPAARRRLTRNSPTTLGRHGV